MISSISSRVLARGVAGGIAALALAATGALAQPEGKGQGGGNGNGNGNGGPPAEARGPDKAPGGNGNSGNGNSGDGAARKGPVGSTVERAQPGNAAGNGNGNGQGRDRLGNGNDVSPGQAKAGNPDMRGNGNRASSTGPKANNGNGNGNGAQAQRFPAQRANNGNGNRNTRMRYGDDPATLIFARNDRLIRDRGILDGCPPGLAEKFNGCTPPGLDRRDPYRFDDSGWWGLPGLSDGRYRYYGGNLVRLSDAGSILGYYPLLGGALSVGNAWPSWYDEDPLPRYTQDYYSLGSSYRYADNVIYRTDPQTDAITSIAALLTGSDFQIGQPMPSGYDVYNVPYGYRDRYRDGPDARYRYSDGYVYQVDPTTQLVVAAIELLA